MRLDVYLTEKFGGEYTRSQITNAIKNNFASVNGKVVTKCGFEVGESDAVECQVDVKEYVGDRAEEIPLDIVYQDKYLMIINKPRGMVVHPGAGKHDGTMLNALLWLSKKESDEKPDRAGIVHRIDKNTAGLLIVAKDIKTQGILSKMIEEHEIERIYLGIVEGQMHGSGTVDRNIIRDPKHRTLFTTAIGKGRHAVTHYEVEKTFARHSLVRFRLETGRTHQIRVHCKSICHPIVGDPEYNPNSSIVKGLGQMLESISVRFIHPVTGENISIVIPPSKLFSETLAKIV